MVHVLTASLQSRKMWKGSCGNMLDIDGEIKLEYHS